MKHTSYWLGVAMGWFWRGFYWSFCLSIFPAIPIAFLTNFFLEDHAIAVRIGWFVYFLSFLAFFLYFCWKRQQLRIFIQIPTRFFSANQKIIGKIKLKPGAAINIDNMRVSLFVSFMVSPRDSYAVDSEYTLQSVLFPKVGLIPTNQSKEFSFELSIPKNLVQIKQNIKKKGPWHISFLESFQYRIQVKVNSKNKYFFDEKTFFNRLQSLFDSTNSKFFEEKTIFINEK